jgi:16S rRNA (guanine966-N2)-methyltransferase
MPKQPPKSLQPGAYSDRIIAGVYKGRPLTLAVSAPMRPTRNRVRQAVFNLLVSRIELNGTRVMDACTGSGAWGLEALSRGAAHVVMTDTDIRTASANWASLGKPAGVELITTDAATYAPSGPFDVVMADPPYGAPVLGALLARRALLGRSSTLWVLEYGSDEHPDFTGFTVLKSQRYGISTVTLLEQI